MYRYSLSPTNPAFRAPPKRLVASMQYTIPANMPVLGPVLTRKGGYAFDCWTPEEGLSRGYTYGRIEDAHYARNVEIRSRNNGSSDQMIACNTVDEFVRLTI
jgi:hypothetical protein